MENCVVVPAFVSNELKTNKQGHLYHSIII
jgi:hypothetical protein